MDGAYGGSLVVKPTSCRRCDVQVNNGALPIEQARAIVAGVGPALPPPRLQGLEVPGAAVPTPAPAYGGAPGGYAPQATGYMPQPTGEL